MISESLLEQVQSLPAAAAAAAPLLALAGQHETPAEFLNEALSLIRETTGGAYAALAGVDRGSWQVLAASGTKRPLPIGVLADVLDRGAAGTSGEWIAAPTRDHAESAELLALGFSAPAPKQTVPLVAALAALVGAALEVVRHRQQQLRRTRRLEAILEIAAQWNQTHEMEPLLVQMAETSTRLLGAERASIFLWDQPNRMLVGRPALGVEGGELRIPDDRGIVGQVIQSGQPRRVDAEHDQEHINREVDRKLGFQTRTLLCVPLRGKSERLFGAFEILNKRGGNFTQEDEDGLVELAAHAAIALENTQEYQQLLFSRRQVADEAAQGVRLIGECPAIQALRSTARRVADTDLAVLILGENGTGKEVVAQMMHYQSRRRNDPFVAVNCAALTETLLESELFGHEKGAFTDAHESRAGKFELASGGTLFLDEIGDMSLGGQAKLLRVLEEKVVVRVGGSRPIHTDARVIAATNQNLAEMVRHKKFREDLYFRLNVVTLDLPPLRERGEDILLLMEHFLRDFCIKARRRPPKLTAAAKKRLLSHAWPGNVRELRNMVERLAYLSEGDKLDAGDLEFILSPGDRPPGAISLDMTLADATRTFQSEYIVKQIASARGNMSQAAQRLGLHRSNLYRKMRQLGMTVDEQEEANGEEP